MTSLLLKSNTLTAAMAVLCWLCSNSLGLMLLWALLLAPAYVVVMAWWALCYERIEESMLPERQPMFPKAMQFIGADDTKPRAHKPPSNA